jgi:Replication protein
MSGTITEQYRPDYPYQLATIRDRVIDVLADDLNERKKLHSCRYKSLCHSIYCPLCSRQDGYGRKDRILGAASHVHGARLRFGTFTVRDVALDSLREASGQIMHTGRRVLKELNVAGYAARLETSFEDWSEKYHPHLHVLIDSASGGRGFISGRNWQEAWLHILPTSLRPVEGGTHITPVGELEATCKYLTKSPFFEHVSNNQLAVERTVNSIRELKGKQRFVARGSLVA